MLEQIHNRYRSLTEAEQKIATFVLSSPERVLRMTAKELAGESGCAPSAVIRFCKAMECDGFSDFKILLARDCAEESSAERLPAFAAEDGAETVFRKVFSSGIRTLQDTLGLLDFHTIKEIAELLFRADRVCIFGIGTSSVIAMDAQYRFSQMGLNAISYTDVLFMNVTAINMKPGDVALAVSHSGQTRAVVDAIRHAKQAGAQTVAVTSFANSLLAKECTHAVTVFADEKNYPVEAVSARVAHICLIDAFMMTLANMDRNSLSDHIKARNRILDEIRY